MKQGNKYARFFALLKQANAMGMNLSYKDLVNDISKGRTSSLNELAEWELQELERNLVIMTGNKSAKKPPVNDTSNKMRRAIIAIFKSIGRTTKDAKEWAEKYGVFGIKREFNEYTEQELWQLIRNAENVRDDHYKALSERKR